MSSKMIDIKNLPSQLRKKGIEEKLVKVCEENDIVFMALFGSFVREEQTRESDVDIAIEFDESKPKSLLDLVHVENELSRILEREVDVGIFSSLNPYIIEDVKKNMEVIYEKR
ncbi:MAG: nucleotidyltransferase family protein [Candidatus Bathyarchaeia archaeon]